MIFPNDNLELYFKRNLTSFSLIYTVDSRCFKDGEIVRRIIKTCSGFILLIVQFISYGSRGPTGLTRFN